MNVDFGNSSRRVTLACVDAMFHLFRPKGKSRRQMTCDVYREYGEFNYSNRSLGRLLLELRVRFRGIELDEEYWQIVNQYLYKAMPARGQKERSMEDAARRAERTHHRFLNDTSLYRLEESVVGVLRHLRAQGIRVVAASNQTDEGLKAMLDHFDVRSLFDEVYTSSQLRIRKPYAGFWERIIEHEGVEKSQVVHLGNSLNSDTGAAKIGIMTFIFNPGQTVMIPRRHKRRMVLLPDTADADLIEPFADGRIKLWRNVTEAKEILAQRLTSPISSTPAAEPA